MLRSAAVVVFTAAFLLSGAARARACKCAEPPPASEAANNAAAVFEGRVTEIKPVGSDDLVVALALVRTWKGAKNLEHVLVRTRKESAACGFPFAQDESYLVYADAVPKQDELPELSVLHCGRTRAIADAEDDLAELGMGAVPVSPGTSELAQTTPPAPPPQKPVPEGVLGAQQSKPAAGGCASCGVMPGRTSAAPMAFALVGLLGLLIKIKRGRSRSRS